jgi:two-component system chemotaxis response regulator CheY
MDKKVILKNFLNEYSVLIVDRNPSSRNRLLKVISDLGAKRNMIFTASGISEASDFIKKEKIGLVLSDYEIEGGSGFDLFKLVRSFHSGNHKMCLILVTGNISQTAIAKAAEEDVDSFIIKPYTLQSIQENLVSSISFKIFPPPYHLKIDEGKELLKQNRLFEAYNCFQEAMELHPKPSLALFYLGYTKYLMMDKSEAVNKYNSGLAINSIHFKCLIGLFDLHMSQKQFEDAYAVVKKIAKYFPANPDRLVEIIRLAVITKNFDDMNMYYEVFTQLEARDPKVLSHMSAGLFVAGKYFLSLKDEVKAITLFDKIAISCAEVKVLKAIVMTLLENGKESEASRYMGRFPGDQLQSPEYLICDFLTTFNFSQDYNLMIQKGMDLYNHGIKDAEILKILINAFEKQGLNEKASLIIEDFKTLYPTMNFKKAS